MEITKVVKPFIRRGANTFGNIVYIQFDAQKLFSFCPATLSEWEMYLNNNTNNINNSRVTMSTM